jgi:hypothetical protein
MGKPVILFLETLFTGAAVAYQKTAVREYNPSSAKVKQAPPFRHLSESMVPKDGAMLLSYCHSNDCKHHFPHFFISQHIPPR